MSRAIVEHINDRVRTVWSSWRWTEFERTEERAFRTVWEDTRQFTRSNAEGVPDEVYYIPTQTYYRVMSSAASDPPIGTVPTDGNYFEVITDLDTFIEYDQAWKRSIGMMRGVYKSNPRNPTGSNWGMLNYMPSENGIDVQLPGVPTVWITYTKPQPEFTIVPYVVGKTYEKADTVFYPATGECFQALIETTALPTDATYWRWIPFLTVWFKYVTMGAFADSLMEFDQGGNGDLQAKAALMQRWSDRAELAFQTEVDTLTAQGQKLTWSFCDCQHGWCRSQPWCGGDVLSIISTTAASIVTDEIPIGSVNAINTEYTTAFEFTTLWVFLNGVKQHRGTDYTLNDHTGFTMTSPPTGGDLLTVDYIRALV